MGTEARECGVQYDGLATPGNAPVYCVEMKGSFRLICRGGPGVHRSCPPTARVLLLIVSASTKRPIGGRTSPGYPSLELAGVPVFLRPVKVHKALSRHA